MTIFGYLHQSADLYIETLCRFSGLPHVSYTIIMTDEWMHYFIILSVSHFITKLCWLTFELTTKKANNYKIKEIKYSFFLDVMNK